MPPMPRRPSSKDALVNVLKVHQAVYEGARCLIGHRILLGMPALMLGTTGRKSGVTPEVEVQVGVRRWPGTAVALRPDDPEHERRFAICNKANGGRFAAYRKMTDRPLPAVVLTRR